MIRKPSFLLTVSISLLFTASCFGLSDNDNALANENFASFIEFLDVRDQVGLESLFAPGKISDQLVFQEDCSVLFSYFLGDYVSHEAWGLGTDYSRESGIAYRSHNMSYDVATTESVYRMAFLWYVVDEREEDNVGLWSFYIIRYDDDPNQSYSYGGDGLWTPGINIGKSYDFTND